MTFFLQVQGYVALAYHFWNSAPHTISPPVTMLQEFYGILPFLRDFKGFFLDFSKNRIKMVKSCKKSRKMIKEVNYWGGF